MCVQDRIRLAYRTSLGYFYRFPEVWQEFAEYELDTGNVPILRMITSNSAHMHVPVQLARAPSGA